MTGGINPSKTRTVWHRDGQVCHYCAENTPEDKRTVDHIWPRVRGGVSANWNLVACCQTCNLAWGEQLDKCTCPICSSANFRHREVLTVSVVGTELANPYLETA